MSISYLYLISTTLTSSSGTKPWVDSKRFSSSGIKGSCNSQILSPTSPPLVPSTWGTISGTSSGQILFWRTTPFTVWYFSYSFFSFGKRKTIARPCLSYLAVPPTLCMNIFGFWGGSSYCTTKSTPGMSSHRTATSVSFSHEEEQCSELWEQQILEENSQHWHMSWSRWWSFHSCSLLGNQQAGITSYQLHISCTPYQGPKVFWKMHTLAYLLLLFELNRCRNKIPQSCNGNLLDFLSLSNWEKTSSVLLQ